MKQLTDLELKKKSLLVHHIEIMMLKCVIYPCPSPAKYIRNK